MAMLRFPPNRSVPAAAESAAHCLFAALLVNLPFAMMRYFTDATPEQHKGIPATAVKVYLLGAHWYLCIKRKLNTKIRIASSTLVPPGD